MDFKTETVVVMTKEEQLHMEKIQALIDRSIPIAGDAMKLRICYISNDKLRLFCPLAPNANDKGTAFAGSIYSALVLSGWALAMSTGYQGGNLNVQAAVAHSETRYYKPMTADFEVIAEVMKIEPEKNRHRLYIQCRIFPPDMLNQAREAVVFNAEYVLFS